MYVSVVLYHLYCHVLISATPRKAVWFTRLVHMCMCTYVHIHLMHNYVSMYLGGETDSDDDNNTGTIVGVTVGVLVGIIIIISFVCRTKWGKQKRLR